MAQVAVESAGLRVLFENMNYSAERIRAVWPKRFPTLASAQRFAGKPRELANKVYGGRMGNTGPDDGWLCRGQGLLETTGRDNLTHLAAHMHLSLEETRARLTSDEGMVACAAATFHMLGCLPFADRDDLVGCTQRINGGQVGLKDRRAALARAATAWPSMRRPAAPLATPVKRPAPVATIVVPVKPVRTAPAPAPSFWGGLLVHLLTPAAA